MASGGISKDRLYFNLQKGGVDRAGVSFEEEQQSIAASQMTLSFPSKVYNKRMGVSSL